MMKISKFGDFFDFEAPDPINFYPFEARCVAAKFYPERFPYFLNLGHNVVSYLFSRPVGSSIPRQIRAGALDLYMPERWLAIKERRELMSRITRLHNDNHPLQRVNVLTTDAVIVSDFLRDMVSIVDID